MKTIATTSTRTKGATNAQKVQFELFAPDAEKVCLAGSFNHWDPLKSPLKKNQKGLWKKSLSLPPGRHEYRFLVDDRWENDPSCPASVDNGFGGQNNVKIVD